MTPSSAALAIAPQDAAPLEQQSESELPRYWATEEAEALVQAIKSKETAYFETLNRRGLMGMWRLMYANYYGQDPTSAGSFETQQIGFDGEEGEQLVFRINETRSFARQQLTMATSQRPGFKCMALNTDYASVSQIASSDTIIGYFYKQEMGEAREREVVESDITFGSGYGWLRWDKDGGDDVEVPGPPETVEAPLPDGSTTSVQQPTTQKVRSGTVVGAVIYPWERVCEPNQRGPHLWEMVRERCSKWELAAQYPAFAEDISSINPLDEYAVEELFGFDKDSATEDDVIVKHFYHARCAAVPNGRYIGLCGDVILWDRGCPVPKGTPIKEMCSGKFIGTALGYADIWDLLAINQAIDQVNSDMLTNLSTHGRMVLVVDEGTDFDVDALANGQRVLTKMRDAAMPQYIEQAPFPDIAFKFLDYAHRRMESISGLNSVARGNPDASVKSGQHAALFHSIAIEFQHARQASLDSYREGMANLMLDLIRMNAEAPFLVEIAGEDERPYLQQFEKQSIAGVRRVVVETANPMMRSQAGRLELYGTIKDLPPDQKAAAIQLITTGQSSLYTRKDATCDMRIKWENEQLVQGIPVQVLALDNPFKHVPSHFAELESLSAQLEQKPEAVKALLDHILEHLPQWLNLDPYLAAFSKVPPPPPKPVAPPGPPGMAPPGPPGPPGPGGPPANDNGRAGPPPGPANDNGQPGAVKDPREQEPQAGIDMPAAAKPPPGAAVPGAP